MAYPVIEGYSQGGNTNSSQASIPITLPNNIQTNEFILGFIASGQGAPTSGKSSSANFHMTPNVQDRLGYQNLTCFYAKAYGNNNDYITIFLGNGSITNWIVYRISGHGMYSGADFSMSYLSDMYRGNFPLVGYQEFPLNNDERLYISAVSYVYRTENLAPPSTWTGFIHQPFNGNDRYGAGVATTHRLLNMSAVELDWWTNTDQSTNGISSITVRIKPGGLPGALDTGVGIVTLPHIIVN